MAKDEILIKAELEVAKARTNIKSLKNEMKGLDMRLTESKEKVKRLALEELKLAKGKRLIIQRNKELSLSQNKLDAATGASTSAALEFGRVISDAPYGIRGVANNLSQLASQFSFMTNKVDMSTGKVVGFKGAIKDLGKALKANAMLIAIQAVIALMDYLSASTTKVSKALSKLGESGASEAITELTLLKKAIEDVSLSLQDKEKLLKKAKEEYEDLNEAIGDTPLNIANTLSALDLLILKYKEVGKAKVLVELITEELKNQSKAAIKTTGSWTDMFNSFDAFILSASSLSKGMGTQTGVSQALANELESSQEAIKKYEDMLMQPTKSNPSKTYLELIYGSDKNSSNSSKSKKVSPFKSKKELDLDIKNQEDALLGFQKKIELQVLKNKETEEIANAKTEEEKTKIKQKYASLRLEIELKNEEKKLILAKSNERAIAKSKHDSHVDELQRIFKEYKLKVELNDKLSKKEKQKLIGDAKSKTDESIVQAGGELIKTNQGIDEAYAPLFKVFNELADLRRKALGIPTGDGSTTETELAGLNDYLNKVKELTSSVSDFISAQYDRRLTKEQNHTNQLNEQLNNRLLNERLSVSERRNIQNQIAKNDEELRKKQNEIKKKQFNSQKAFNISSALIETYLAANKALQTFGGVPTGLPAMAATITAGLLNVATIASQKFQPEAASTPIRTASGGGGGGGVGNRTFDFNLVGNNQQNQLAEAIGGQFDRPLKAYVVSKDISNQQQLDANIKSSARFGG